MYYLIGVNEPEMRNLATFLSKMGYLVCCHESEKNETVKHIFTNKSCSESMIAVKGERVVEDDFKLVEARNVNLKIYSYLQVIDFIIKKHKTIIVFGENVFLSILLANVLDDLKGCNCIIGENKIAADKKNIYMVLNIIGKLTEKPKYVIIESGHLNQFIVEHKEILNKTEKIIFADGDNQEMNIDLIRPIFLYGLDKKNDIFVQELKKSKKGYVFDVMIEDGYYGHFDLPIKAKSDINAVLAVISICAYERFLAKDVSRVLKKYLKKG